ncbi:capsid protein [Lactobacillus sp. ESL0681]|uniref:capsid protein n=1 Tax=Lactobacillus sp. ESL0681 TaxID=2983211 RepID=UPI0023FA3A87|nr:capsid protein [Lactobacillus sp. ESL0681]WEV40354.1 capsid protein [Lactobacillus sp. ESL0681]
MTTINFAEQYQQAIQDSFYNLDGVLYSRALWNSPANSMIKFDGAKHIKLPKLTILSGRKDRQRRTITGFSTNYSNDWESYELTNERYWQTLVDPLDVDETNYVVSIANITKQFNLTQKMPEQDRFMFSRLFSQKQELDGGQGIHNETLDENNILEAFDTMMLDFDEARVPAQNRVLYITPKINAILKRAVAKNRSMSIDANNPQRTVYSIDSVKLVIVPADLMQTAFDFSDGSKVIDSSKQIDMFLIYNGIQLAPEKYSFSGFDQPSAANSGNYLYYEESYNDVLLLQTKTAGIEFVVSDKPTVAPAPEVQDVEPEQNTPAGKASKKKSSK